VNADGIYFHSKAHRHGDIADTQHPTPTNGRQILLLILDPLYMIMQTTIIEITVAGALIMKPNFCNEDYYLLGKDTVILGRHMNEHAGPICW
jgi:hypothetical protein